jgi:hypothetical protein
MISRFADRAPKFRKPAPTPEPVLVWEWNRDGDRQLKVPGYLFTATPLPGGRTRLKITPEAQTLELRADEYKSRVAALLAG